MELKFGCVNLIPCHFRVLIVPLWNWNGLQLQNYFVYASVLIVPLWNWNSNKALAALTEISVLIVPLWNWNLRLIAHSIEAGGSNRTFMELKYHQNIFCLTQEQVLIVPLWNWNTTRERFCIIVLFSSNRTFMELKWASMLHPFSTACSSNRTFMELKWLYLRSSFSTLKVLIVPLWNWN